MKTLTSYVLGFITLILGLALALPALAMTPSLSINYSNGSNTAPTVTVSGDPYSQVSFYYYAQGSFSNPVFLQTLGTTNSSGYLSTVLSGSISNIPQSTNVYVVVNGQQSTSVPWNYNGSYNNNNGSITFSQSSVNVNVGQTVTVSAYNNYNSSYNYNTFYVSNNSSSNIATASISGSQIIIDGINYGSTSFTVCSSGNSTSCGTIYVTVGTNGSYYGQSITLSQTSLSLILGQSSAIGISGGNASNYYVASNSNPNVATANVSGTSLNVYAVGVGSTSMSICSYSNGSGSNCATLYITSTQTGAVAYQYPTSGTPSSGVYLSSVPYTGVDSASTYAFVGVLALWSAALAFFVVNRKKLAF